MSPSSLSRRHFIATAAAAATSSFAAVENKPRVAVIGHTGRGNYGHGLDTVWLGIPEVELVAVADADDQGREAAAKKLQLSRSFSDYRAMLSEIKPEVVSIGPRHVDQHHAMILACIEAGVRGIYMEKPFVRSLVEADEVVKLCAEKKVKLAVAHRNRYHPVMPVVAQLVKDGAIGRLLEFRARGKEDARGGALDLWVLGSHLLNLVNFFGGKPLACVATVLQEGKPVAKEHVKDGDEGIGPLAGNEVHARWEMECGVPAFFDSVQNAGVKSAGFGVQLIGTQGIIDLRTDEEPAAQILKGTPFHPTAEARPWIPISTAGIGKPEPIANLKSEVASHAVAVRDLLAAMRDDRAPLCGAEDARTTIEMISSVFESHRLHSQRVELPMKTRVNPLTLL